MGSTDGGEKEFWQIQCGSIPTEATMVRVDMGEVKDFFKPSNGHTMCEMLLSHTQHMWSPDGQSWETPVYYPGHLGGSIEHWPRDNKQYPADQRRHLSFWGGGPAGGCCRADYTSPNYAAWYQAFTMYTCSE